MKSIRRLSWILLVVLTILIPNTAYAISGVDCLPAVTITEDDIDTAFVTLIDMTEGTESTESLRAEIDNLHQDIVDRGYEYLLPQGYNSMRIVLDQESLENLLVTLQGIEQQIEEIEAEKAYRAEVWPKGEAIANVSYSVPSSPAGFCAAYISRVYSRAGYPYPSLNACDYYWKYATSSNRDDIMPGMIIAVPSHTHTSAGRRWGHIGLIVQENGQWIVRHSSGGRVLTWTLDEWISYYGTTYTPQWGFAADVLRR